MNIEIQNYFNSKKLKYKVAINNQVILEKCPYCLDEKNHFYMNQDSGVWICFKCSSRGNFNDFREAFGDNPIKIVYKPSDNKEVEKLYHELDQNLANLYAGKLWGLYLEDLKYLQDTRKLEKATLEYFKIGSTGQKISIPVFKNKKLVSIRYRRSPKDNTSAKYTQEVYCRSELFNGDVIEDLKPKEIFITEGEIDAMTLWQQGYKNVVSTTLGAGFFPEDWVNRMKGIEKFYIIYDTDEEGQRGAMKVAKKIGIEKCAVINLPVKQGRKKTDINEYFIEDGYTKKDFEKLLASAKTVIQKDILHISDLNEALREFILKGEVFGALTGYDQLDLLMGGLRKGRLIILSGLTSVGKSSLANCIGLSFAKRNLPAFFFSLEMPPVDLAKKILILESELTLGMLKNIKDPSAELQSVDHTLMVFKSLPIYIYSGSGEINVKVLRASIKTCIEKYDCKVVIIDHLHYFAHNFSNTTQETAGIVRQIKQIAISLNIPIILLAHLNRGGRATQKRGLYMPALSDLRDCFTGDTKIFDFKDKKSKTLAEVCTNKDRCSLEVLEHSGKKNIVANLLCHKTGKKKIYKVILENGIEVKASENSKLYKLTGWKKIKDLREGDYVSFSLFKNRANKASSYDLDFLFLIGILISDGSIDNDLTITTNDKEVVKFIEKIVEKRGMKTTVRNRFNAFMVNISKNTPVYRNPLKEILKQLRLFGVKSKNKFIPDEFKNLSEVEICNLLKGLYQGDGSYSKHTLKYTSNSLKLVKDIRYLWQVLGIKSSVSKANGLGRECIIRGKKFIVVNPTYDLIISDIEGVTYFKENIGFVGVKNNTFLRKFKGKAISYSRQSKLPPEIIDILLEKKGKRSWREFGYRIQKNGIKYKLPSKSMLLRIATKFLKDDELYKLAFSELEFTSIKEIEYLGEVETYDFDVPKYHHFFLENGLLVHNSGAIEQDADQVLFVCRDSENEVKEERQRTILKIAKNRDGMAGRTVSMNFDEELGYFEETTIDYAKAEEKKQAEEKEEITTNELAF